MIQVHRRRKASMALSFFLMDDDMKECFTQLKEKITQLTKVIFRLVIPLMQAQILATPITKLSLLYFEAKILHLVSRVSNLEIQKISLQ